MVYLTDPPYFESTRSSAQPCRDTPCGRAPGVGPARTGSDEVIECHYMAEDRLMSAILVGLVNLLVLAVRPRALADADDGADTRTSWFVDAVDAEPRALERPCATALTCASSIRPSTYLGCLGHRVLLGQVLACRVRLARCTDRARRVRLLGARVLLVLSWSYYSTPRRLVVWSVALLTHSSPALHVQSFVVRLSLAQLLVRR